MSEATRELFETVAKVLLFCLILGLVLQLTTLGAVLGMGDIIHDLHSALFGLSSHESDLITAGYSALIKVFTAIFFLIPWVAIRIVLRKPKN